jgi:hypothetical protein
MADDLSQHLFCIARLFLRLPSNSCRAELDPVHTSGIRLPFVKVPSLPSTIATATACHDKPRIIRSALASRNEVVNMEIFLRSAIDAPFVTSKHECSKLRIAAPQRLAVGSGGPFSAVHGFAPVLPE